MGELPDASLDAATLFCREYLPQVEQLLGDRSQAITIVMPQAGQKHDDWRRALARDLARAHAPQRVNVIAGNEVAHIDATLRYLEASPGVTGQYIPTHD